MALDSMADARRSISRARGDWAACADAMHGARPTRTAAVSRRAPTQESFSAWRTAFSATKSLLRVGIGAGGRTMRAEAFQIQWGLAGWRASSNGVSAYDQ